MHPSAGQTYTEYLSLSQWERFLRALAQHRYYRGQGLRCFWYLRWSFGVGWGFDVTQTVDRLRVGPCEVCWYYAEARWPREES